MYDNNRPINKGYFDDNIKWIGDYFTFYTRASKEKNEFGEVVNTYNKRVIYGNLQPDGVQRTAQDKGSVVAENYRFYNRSNTKIFIDDIIKTNKDVFLQVYEALDYDPVGVMVFKVRSINITQDRDFEDFKNWFDEFGGDSNADELESEAWYLKQYKNDADKVLTTKQDALTPQQLQNINDVINKADINDVYNKQQTDELLNTKQNNLTAQQLNNINLDFSLFALKDDFYNKTQTDEKIAYNMGLINNKQDALNVKQLSNLNANLNVYITKTETANLLSAKQNNLTPEQLNAINDVNNKANANSVYTTDQINNFLNEKVNNNIFEITKNKVDNLTNNIGNIQNINVDISNLQTLTTEHTNEINELKTNASNNETVNELNTNLNNLTNKVNTLTDEQTVLTNQLLSKQENLTLQQLNNINDIPNKADANAVYTKAETDEKLDLKVNKTDLVHDFNFDINSLRNATVNFNTNNKVWKIPDINTLSATTLRRVNGDGTSNNNNYVIKLFPFDTREKVQYLLQYLKQASTEIKTLWANKMADVLDTARISNQDYSTIYQFILFDIVNANINSTDYETYPRIGGVNPNENANGMAASTFMNWSWKLQNKQAIATGLLYLLNKYNWNLNANNIYYVNETLTYNFIDFLSALINNNVNANGIATVQTNTTASNNTNGA